jgi:hypothetical protein
MHAHHPIACAHCAILRGSQYLLCAVVDLSLSVYISVLKPCGEFIFSFKRLKLSVKL